MYLFFTFLIFLLALGVILAFFSAIVTSGSYEWPTVLLIFVVVVPFAAHKIYRTILEYTDLDFLYVGHHITSEEQITWRRISLKLLLAFIIFGALAAVAFAGFVLSGGPTLQEFVLRQGRRVPVDRPLLDLLLSYACYLVGLLFSSLALGYFGVLIRGWYYSSNTTTKFHNTYEATKNLLLRILSKITGIEMKRED